MNFFQKTTDNHEKQASFHFNTMFEFGQRMKDAMEIKIPRTALGEEMIWEVDGFILSIRSFPQNGWTPTIIACPKTVDGSRVGYRNTDEQLPSSWYYHPAGTATVFYPPQNIQNEIIHRIKQKKLF